MGGQRVGYVRVSSVDQNTDRQLDGIQLDRVFTDKASGKDTERPALQEMLLYIREGDQLWVHSMDRLSRSLDDLRRTVKELTARGVLVKFVKEGLTFDGDDSAMSQLLLSVMSAVSEFELAHIGSRQREGIALAKLRGVYKGRKRALTAEQAAEIRQRAAAGEQKTALALEFKVSRETLYKVIRESAAVADWSRTNLTKH